MDPKKDILLVNKTNTKPLKELTNFEINSIITSQYKNGEIDELKNTLKTIKLKTYRQIEHLMYFDKNNTSIYFLKHMILQNEINIIKFIIDELYIDVTKRLKCGTFIFVPIICSIYLDRLEIFKIFCKYISFNFNKYNLNVISIIINKKHEHFMQYLLDNVKKYVESNLRIKNLTHGDQQWILEKFEVKIEEMHLYKRKFKEYIGKEELEDGIINYIFSKSSQLKNNNYDIVIKTYNRCNNNISISAICHIDKDNIVISKKLKLSPKSKNKLYYTDTKLKSKLNLPSK